MKKLLLALLILASLVAVVELFVWQKLKDAEYTSSRVEKAYVAIEGTGEIAVINTYLNKLVKRISLSQQIEGKQVMYMPHNVQVGPKGDKVWVTGNAMSESTHDMSWLERLLFPKAYAHSGEGELIASDQVIVIDANTDKIIQRIDIGKGLHLAHIALTPDGRYAIATSQEEGIFYKIDTSSYTVAGSVSAVNGSEPHGLRISPDGSWAYVAMMGGKSLAKLNIANLSVSYTPLNGPAVQAGVTPNGKYAFASIYNPPGIGLYETRTSKVTIIPLPKDAKGPVQLYPSPDSRYVFVADQGYYFDQPQGKNLYKINLETMNVVDGYEVGTAPHGIVVSHDGTRIYVTNLLGNDVSVVDADTGKVITKIAVGESPNGISLRSRIGGTP